MSRPRLTREQIEELRKQEEAVSAARQRRMEKEAVLFSARTPLSSNQMLSDAYEEEEETYTLVQTESGTIEIQDQKGDIVKKIV